MGMVMGMAFLMHADAVVVIAGVMVLGGGHAVALEQTDAEQQRQGHVALDRAQDARL